MKTFKLLVSVLWLSLSINLPAQDFSIKNLGAVVNSSSDDYAPVISPDGQTLFFVSFRDGSIIDAKGLPSHDFWAAKRTSKSKMEFQIPFNLDPSNKNGENGLNTAYNEGVASFSPDGKKIYFTACNRPNNYGPCDIMMVELTKTGWSRAVNLGNKLNSKYWDAQPSIAPDGTRLYFTSTRPGPNGRSNMDIWFSDYDAENEEWLEAKNLSQLNTSGKECGPFIAPDNVTLFFSSDNYKPNLGGLDFYASRFDIDFQSWGQPAHLSAPISTSEDDLFISLPASGDVMFFSSQRTDIAGQQGGLDIYATYTKALFNAVVLKITVKDDKTGEYIYSNLTIRNPITGRTIRDEMTIDKPILDVVVSDTDFGTTSDSIPFIDWEIIAENDVLGKTSQTVRVGNPKHKDFNDFRAFTDNLGISLEFAVKGSEDSKRIDVPEQSILSAHKNLVAFENDQQVALDTISIKQQAISVSKPLLGYIFFDENKFIIPDRYSKKSNSKLISNGEQIFDNTNTIDVYRNVLNIIGERMQKIAEANITLTGCNMDFGDEKGNANLSKIRAESVKEYLVDNYSISPDRIAIKSRNLPEKPSNNSIVEGREENRRVEIVSDYSEILAPLITKDTVLITSPSLIRFVDPIDVEFGEAYWSITLFDKHNKYKEFFGEGPTKYNIDWNTKDLTNYNNTDNYLRYDIVVNDKTIRKTIVGKDSIPIKYDLLKDVKQDKIVEKFSLILFDFGSNRIDGANKAMLETINSKISNNSKVNIIGYSDSIGDDNFNLRLSKSRASETAKLIKHNNKQSDGIGEQELLFDNSTPEGRFYCRTVDVIIETAVK